ncbi:2-hydroxyhepta-2,4-diene-1,7-dioate isomerase (Fumarylacetoacetase) [Colletotrichum tofieldiae]|uniref:Fumarylacetoacetase n=1 Tax=Colletotrichum tofieldiae TaxID=708197 RepID=A0A166QN47_9PEZI|nr:2-hydroxyhepta-2,4-diene-1,7-dioate isomerase (Fumarylacetoacetase) [Colletotrichum tofieldiae]
MGAFPGHDEVPSNSYHIPLAYNGRASSVVISGVPIIRPWGYIPTPDGPKFQPTQKMDFEVEMGIFIAKPLDIGEAVPASQARDHIFGMVLLNDWSARDIKFYEMVPLGPFNGKACGTSISPWIVTLDALEEAGAVIDVEAGKLPGGKWAKDSFLAYSRDVSVQVTTHISRMAAQKPSFPQQWRHSKSLFAQSKLKHLHWSPLQMVAHQSSAGCGLNSGDLLCTGTMSSTEQQASEDGVLAGTGRSGCLQEATKNAKHPLPLENGQKLIWIEDGDEVVMEA